MNAADELARLYPTLLRMARRYPDPEDLVHDTALRILTSEWDGRPLLPWASVIMLNLVRDQARRHREERVAVDPPSRESADDRANAHDILRAVRAVFHASVAGSTLIEFAKGYSVREIAQRQAITEASVRRRVHDARAMLRVELSRLKKFERVKPLKNNDLTRKKSRKKSAL